jgi:radical SAM protein with 4Fe4S-binding SPASM domain
MLAYEQVSNILKEAKMLGTRTIEISGGEPLLHPHIENIIGQASKDFEVRLYTSGFTGGHNGIPRSLMASFKKLGLNRIIFNLQGASAEVHERITQTEGSFDSAVASIKNAKDIGLWTGVHFVPMLPNFGEIRHLAELCSLLSVDELAILRFVNQGRGSENLDDLELSSKDFHELVLKIVDEKKKYKNMDIRTGCPMNFCSFVDTDIKPVKCKAGLSTLLINFDGQVVPCPAFKQTGVFTIGNICETSLLFLWEESSQLQELRNFDFKKISGCEGCNRLDTCQGRCMAQRFYYSGSIYAGPDPLCPFRKKDHSSPPKTNELFVHSN